MPRFLNEAVIGLLLVCFSFSFSSTAQSNDPLQIFGRVVASDTGLAIISVRITAYSDAGQYDGFVDEQGNYEIEVPEGSYKMEFRSFDVNYISECYEDVPAYLGQRCQRASNNSVVIGDSSVEVNAELDRALSIFGRVTDSLDGAPLSVSVSVKGDNGFDSNPHTDADGYFDAIGLISGSYTVKFFAPHGYVTEVYDEADCTLGGIFPGILRCDPNTFEKVHLSGQSVELNEELTRQQISGRVTDAETGEPLSRVSVRLTNSELQIVGSSFTDADGYYSTRGLPDAAYGVSFHGPDEFMQESYDNQHCIDCQGKGSPVVVMPGIVSVDAALDRGPVVRGVITDRDTGEAILARACLVAKGGGTQQCSDRVQGGEEYVTPAVPPGQYYLSFRASSTRYPTFSYPDVPCARPARCSANRGDLISLDGVGLEIDASIYQQNFFGVVTDARDGQPLSGRLRVYAEDGTFVTDANTSLEGEYSTLALNSGVYYLAFAADDYVTELHDAKPCDGFACQIIEVGDAIEIANGSQQVDATLEVGATISGTVVDKNSGAPLRANILAFDESGQAIVRQANSDESGAFTLRGLGPGNYFIQVNPSNRKYLRILYPDIYCPNSNCDVTAGRTVMVLDQDVEILVGLEMGAQIEGQVTDANDLTNSVDARVSVFDEQGAELTRNFYRDNYQTPGLPTGSYFLIFDTQGTQQGDEVYDELACLDADCDAKATLGKLIVLEAPETVIIDESFGPYPIVFSNGFE